MQVHLIRLQLCMFNIDNVKQVKICKCSVQEFWDVVLVPFLTESLSTLSGM